MCCVHDKRCETCHRHVEQADIDFRGSHGSLSLAFSQCANRCFVSLCLKICLLPWPFSKKCGSIVARPILPVSAHPVSPLRKSAPLLGIKPALCIALFAPKNTSLLPGLGQPGQPGQPYDCVEILEQLWRMMGRATGDFVQIPLSNVERQVSVLARARRLRQRFQSNSFFARDPCSR